MQFYDLKFFNSNFNLSKTNFQAVDIQVPSVLSSESNLPPT